MDAFQVCYLYQPKGFFTCLMRRNKACARVFRGFIRKKKSQRWKESDVLLQEIKGGSGIMKEKDLPIDFTKHKVYSKNAKKCVLKLLHRYHDGKTAAELWEKIRLQYCEYLKDDSIIQQ